MHLSGNNAHSDSKHVQEGYISVKVAHSHGKRIQIGCTCTQGAHSDRERIQKDTYLDYMHIRKHILFRSSAAGAL